MKGPHRAIRFQDVARQKFGLLTAVWPAGAHKRACIWFCVCDCGGLAYRRLADLRRKREISCGCRVGLPTHGMSGTSEWNSYQDAKNRCTNPRHHAWKDYGGRGIKFLFTSFEQFYAEMGTRPAGLQLDRTNNSGNYEPGNVRWATPEEQNNNKRNPWAEGGGHRESFNMKCPPTEVKRMYEEGSHIYEIADRFHVARNTISLNLRRMGVRICGRKERLCQTLA